MHAWDFYLGAMKSYASTKSCYTTLKILIGSASYQYVTGFAKRFLFLHKIWPIFNFDIL